MPAEILCHLEMPFIDTKCLLKVIRMTLMEEEGGLLDD